MAPARYQKVEQGGSEKFSDADSGDEELHRTSEDVRMRDRETLHEEEEAERLLTKGDVTTTVKRHGRSIDGQSSKHKSSKKRRKDAEKRVIMYEMEEGGPHSGSLESSRHSSEDDLARLGKAQTTQRRRGSRFCKFAAIHVVIVVAFLGLLYGAFRASKGSNSVQNAEPPPPVPAESGEPSRQEDKEPVKQTKYEPVTLSNGSHTFAPTTIIISLDGFRADFLHRELTPTLNSFIREGVSPKYMLPSFPSVTFPNHFTLVTGLHPESHGLVGNTFWDPELQKEFFYTDPARSMQPEWWNAEPIWVTAEKNGVRAGVHMWPGSEVKGGIGGMEATYADQFNGDEHLENKVRRILGWLDLPDGNTEALGTADVPEMLRPQLIAAYVPNVDSDGHLYGPNSTYIRSTIAEVDSMLRMLLKGLDERNLTDIVNIIIVSDHGMATTSINRLIQLEDLLDTSLIQHIDGWPLYGLRPHDTSEKSLQSLYESLLQKSKDAKYKHAYEVYLRDENMPERYHFSQNERIAPLWIVPKAGWAIVTKDEFDVDAGVRNDETYHPRGLHGYDHEHALMRAIFVARGPAFPHVAGSKLEPFQNTEVYNILCDSLGIEPVANNGTLRLPLKPSGIHDFDETPEIPEDPQDDPSLALPPEVPNLAYPHTGPAQTVHTHLPPEVPNLANRPDFMPPTEGVPPLLPTASVHPSAPATSSTPDQPTTPEQIGQPNAPADDAAEADDDSNSEADRGWWSWVTGKVEAIKGWAYGLFGAHDEGEGDE